MHADLEKKKRVCTFVCGQRAACRPTPLDIKYLVVPGACFVYVHVCVAKGRPVAPPLLMYSVTSSLVRVLCVCTCVCGQRAACRPTALDI